MRRIAITIAALTGGLLGHPVLAQDNQPTVKELLNRAQSGADQKAVEDLIKKLKESPGNPQSGTSSPGAAVATPPATPTPVTTPGSPPAAQPTTAARTQPGTEGQPGTESSRRARPSGAPTADPAPPSTAAAPPPANEGRTTPASSGSSPAPAEPQTGAAPGGSGGSAPGSQASSDPGVAGPPMGTPEVMARAPEIASRLGLPTADLEVYFEYDRAEIIPPAMTTLAILGEALADPQFKNARFIIAGHTDGKGRPDYNLALSQRRAEAVRTFIIAQYNIDPNSVVARGFGRQRLKNPRRPFAAENRRVQIINWTSQTAVGRNRRR